ncbi:MAG: hypothetical protein KBE09_03540 [Candidatus Pacebacteria bacterium]|nr:hypothetical protein [Candidatus Paceibacterota bacterium]
MLVKKLEIPVLIAVLVASVFLGAAPLVHAQSPEAIEITPAVIEDRVTPGQTYRFAIKVTNGSQTEKTFYLGAQDISGLDERGVPLFAEEGQPTEYELSSWIRLPQESVVIGPGETRSIPYVINVPSNASPGAHFGGVFLDVRPPKLRTIGAGIGMRTGSIINLRIAGDVQEDARIREFSTEKIVYSDAEIDFSTKVENLGNVLLRPHGLIEISDMFGRQVGSVRVNETGSAMFPKGDRNYVTTWEYDKFAFGRYQALVSIVYGDDSRKTLSATTSFWVLPLKPILIALSSLLAFVLLLYGWMRLYINRKLREMGVNPGKRADTYYVKKYNRSASRLMMILIGVFIFSVMFLFALFMLFA